MPLFGNHWALRLLTKHITDENWKQPINCLQHALQSCCKAIFTWHSKTSTPKPSASLIVSSNFTTYSPCFYILRFLKNSATTEQELPRPNPSSLQVFNISSPSCSGHLNLKHPASQLFLPAPRYSLCVTSRNDTHTHTHLQPFSVG